MSRSNESYSIASVFRLAKRLRKYAVRMVVTVISGVIKHLSTIGVSVMCAYIVGQALTGELNGRMYSLTVWLLILIALQAAFYYAEMWLAHWTAFRVLADFRVDLLASIERVSPAILLGMRSGQLASTLMSDVEVLEWFYAHTFGSMIVAAITSVILLAALWSFHYSLALVMLAFLLLLLCVPLLMRRRASAQGKAVRDDLGEASSVTVEGVQGMREILMLDGAEAYGEKNRRYMQKMYNSQLRYGKRLGAEGALMQTVSGIGMLTIAGLAAKLVLGGQLDASLYAVIVILAGMTFSPVLEICGVARNFGLIFAAANRVERVIDAEPQVNDDGGKIDGTALEKDLRFENVSFRYDDDLPLVLQNVGFTVAPGETVALVGPSGAGKSTCVNLLLRYWDPACGAVQIGGRPLPEMKLDDLRDLTAAVLQDVFLFHGTIRENLLLGKPEASEAEMIQAAKDASIHDFIAELPDGYDTIAGERGVRLSGGQRQRIAIARAILKGSPILILDEAVSNLDAENEAEIQKVLDRTRGKRTTLIVAHRLSTILSADKLIVLNNGHVEQIGTHAELVAQPGFYRTLVGPQLIKEKC